MSVSFAPAGGSGPATLNLKACRHSTGRLLYRLACASLLLAAGLLLLLAYHHEVILRTTKVEVARAFFEDVDEPFTDRLLGVWHFEQGPFANLTLRPQGKFELVQRVAQDGYEPQGYRTGPDFVMLEGVSTKSGAAQSAVLFITRADDTTLAGTMNGQAFSATRDLEASADILMAYKKQAPQGVIGTLVYYYSEYGTFLNVALLITAVVLFFWGVLRFGRGNTQVMGILVTERQFPKAFAIVRELTQQLGFAKVPEIYLVNGMGAYNAYASCVPGRRGNYMAFYYEVFAGFEKDENVEKLKGIVAHELGHLMMGHVGLQRIIVSALFGLIPGLKQLVADPISRACEHEADRVAMQLVGPRHMAEGLLYILAGRELANKVSLTEYRRNSIGYDQIMLAVDNFTVNHPTPAWRIDAICRCKQVGLFYHRMKLEGEDALP